MSHNPDVTAQIGYWQQQAKCRRISRREFLGRATTLGVTFIAATRLLSEVGLAEEGKRGGNARFGLAHGSTTDSLDPSTYSDTFTQTAFWGALSNSLCEVDEKGEIVGDLAETFESDKVAKVWMFKLRRGLTFHNGQTVKADDVVASFRHHMGPTSKSAAKPLLDSIESIESDGSEVVKISLKAGNADWPYVVSVFNLPIMPTKDGAADWQSGIRSGPFALKDFQPGISARLTRNPNYHKSNRPFLDQVEFFALPDLASRSSSLITGDVDYIARCDLKSLPQLAKNERIEIDEVTGYGHHTFPMNVTIPPFDNVDVRLAIKYAIDREDIARKIFLGHAVAANDNPIAPTVKYATDPKPRFSYDVDKAKYHLKKAGLTQLSVDLSVADAAFTGAVDAAVLVREHASKAGINVNVDSVSNDGYYENTWMKKAWAACFWAGRPTCDWLFTQVYSAGASWNDTSWKNPRFNELLLQARAETDDGKRALMYGEMQQLLHDDGGAVVLVFNNYVTAHSKRLAHNQLGTNLENDGYKIAERWWFKD